MAGPKQRQDLGSGQGQFSGPIALEKPLGAVGGWAWAQGTDGAQVCPPPLVSEGRGPHLGAQQASSARVGGAITLGSSPAPPRGPPPASPDLPSLSPMPPRPTRPGWGFGGGVPAWELSRLPDPSGPGDRPLLLSRFSHRVPPACLS